MAPEILKRTDNIKIRTDGIEAKGLDENYNLIVDRTPKINYLANSTPELILRKIYEKSEEPLKSVYKDILDKFQKFPPKLFFNIIWNQIFKYFVKRTGNKSALMHFYIENPGEFAKKSDCQLIECRGFYKDALEMLSKKLSLYTKISMKIADKRNNAMILHLKL